jgi:hypothetical protein
MILAVVVQLNSERNLTKNSSGKNWQPAFITQFVAVSEKHHDIWCF